MTSSVRPHAHTISELQRFASEALTEHRARSPDTAPPWVLDHALSVFEHVPGAQSASYLRDELIGRRDGGHLLANLGLAGMAVTGGLAIWAMAAGVPAIGLPVAAATLGAGFGTLKAGEMETNAENDLAALDHCLRGAEAG